MNNPEIKTDCFAFRGPRNKHCSVLNELVCQKQKCSFYKTCEQYKNDLKKYSKR